VTKQRAACWYIIACGHNFTAGAASTHFWHARMHTYILLLCFLLLLLLLLLLWWWWCMHVLVRVILLHT
jgi:hypothetical protein